MSTQLLIKKTPTGGYLNIFPKSYTDAILDKLSSMTLNEILQSFNCYFLSYNGSAESTRKKVPMSLRKEGLWITYVLYDHTVITEWYNDTNIDDDSWSNSSNWRKGSNTLVGDISISSNGNWVIDGVETEFYAGGEPGITPILRIYNNKLQVSYNEGKTWAYVTDNPIYTLFRFNSTTNTYLVSTDLGATWKEVSNDKVYYYFRFNEETNTHQVSLDLGNTWTNINDNKVYYLFRTSGNKLQVSTDLGKTWSDTSDYIAAWFRWSSDNKIQISRTNSGEDWQDFSGSFVDKVRIKKYIGINESLPTSGIEEGTIYMKGPYYDENDTNNDNPIYRMWVYAWKGDTLAWQDNGEFTSIAAGVVQETGNSESNVMSQKATSLAIYEIENLIDGKQLLSAPIEGYNMLPIQTLKAGKVYTLTNEGDALIYVSEYAFFNSDEITVLKNRVDGSQGARDDIPKGGWETFYVNQDVVSINIRFKSANGIFSIKEVSNKIEDLQAKDIDLQEQIDTNAFESNQKKQFKGADWTYHEYIMHPELTYNIKQISDGSILGVEAKDSDGNSVAVSGFTTLSNIGESCDIKVAKDVTILRVYHNSGAVFEIKNNLQDYTLDAIASINETDTKQNANIAELKASCLNKKQFSGAGWSAWATYNFRGGYAYTITNVSDNPNSIITAFELRNNTQIILYKGDSITNLTQGQTATVIPNGNATEFRAYYHNGEGQIEISWTLDTVENIYDLNDAVQIQEGYSSKDQIKNQVIVAKDGADGHFATIAEAYASIKDSSYTNQYEVIVYPGKYNEVNLQVPPFTHTHGAFPNSVTISSEGYNTTQPVIEQAHGSSKLSNLTIESHTGYCIHYDQNLSLQVIVNTNLFLNKVAIGQGATNWSIIGGGTFYNGTKYVWKNCTFRCTELGIGDAACHTNGNQVNGNTTLIFDGCIFINCYPSIGSVGGSGNYICELTNCSFPVGAKGLTNWFSPIRNIEDPTLYRLERNEWNIIGGGNKNLSMWQLISGKTIRLVADYPIAISGSAANIIFGYNPTKNDVKTQRLNCTLTSEYYIADEQAGYSGYSELRDVFQLWKRLGDCSSNNKELTVTVNNVSKTYTFTEDYLTSKTAQADIIAAMQTVLDNVTIEAITQSGYGYFNVNTSDCLMVKVMSDDIIKGEFVTLGGEKATSSTSINDIVGVACEDKPHGEYVKVWTSAFRFDTDYADGEYGLDTNGALDANAVTKIGFVKGYNFYLY